MKPRRRTSIDRDRLVRMDHLKLTPATNNESFNVVYIGAGNIMFGSEEGPWNHSFRFEHKLGPRLKVVALIDPNLDRCQTVLKEKRASFVQSAYKDTKVYKSIDEFHAGMTRDVRPKIIVVGSPPAFRGSDIPGADLELLLLKYFPKVALFIEKPVSTHPVEKAMFVSDKVLNSGIVCSVGYMLRYLQAVQMVKAIIEEKDLEVMATTARYVCAYEKIAKKDWWNKAMTCGPIVEQATHFCDLSRYFGGDVVVPSVQAHSLEFYEAPGKLSKVPIDESKIPESQRIPRVTSATWKYESGGVGTLTHLVSLQGTNYACELEIYCDGYLFKIIDPYNAPQLRIRRPGDDHEEVHHFPSDDPFFSEVSNLIDVVEDGPNGDRNRILSSYEDAVKTYELTWAIRAASEYNRTLPRSGLKETV